MYPNGCHDCLHLGVKLIDQRRHRQPSSIKSRLFEHRLVAADDHRQLPNLGSSLATETGASRQSTRSQGPIRLKSRTTIYEAVVLSM